jgi:hypothetical protein
MGIRNNLTGAAALDAARELKKIRELAEQQLLATQETNRLLAAIESRT